MIENLTTRQIVKIVSKYHFLAKIKNSLAINTPAQPQKHGGRNSSNKLSKPYSYPVSHFQDEATKQIDSEGNYQITPR